VCAGSTLQLAKQSLDEAPYINCPKLSLSQSASPSVALFALLLIDIPWFLTEGKLADIFIKTFSWGLPTGQSFTTIQQVFWHHQLGPITPTAGMASSSGQDIPMVISGFFVNPFLYSCLYSLFFLNTVLDYVFSRIRR
jgi:hypothetical protein